MKNPKKTPRALRLSAGLTQMELAVRAGLSLATICRSEKAGDFQGRPSTRRRLAAALQVSL